MIRSKNNWQDSISFKVVISLLKITKFVCSLIASLFPFDDNTNLLEKKEKNESRIVEGLYFCINDK